MIAVPLNDRECLDKMTALAVEATKRDDVRALAQRFGSTRSLAAWIRSLPQRDDDGNATDGPRVTCDVSQRVRIGADDPNCVERGLLYIATAEVLDANATRSLATIETPAGRHTFPVEDGRPVVLDPNMRRNQLAAGLWLMQVPAQRNAGLLDAKPRELLAWLADIAEEPATDLDGAAGRERIARARSALARMLDGGAQLAADQVDDVLYLLDHATEASELYGRAGRYGAQLARSALARLGVGVRRNGCECPRNVKIAGYNVRPDWDAIEKYGTTGAYVGGKVAVTYYGGPLAGSLWDPAFQSVTGKTPQKALAPLGRAAPVVGAATNICAGAAATLAGSGSSSTAPSSQSTTSTTSQQAQPLQLAQQFMTLAAFATRR